MTTTVQSFWAIAIINISFTHLCEFHSKLTVYVRPGRRESREEVTQLFSCHSDDSASLCNSRQQLVNFPINRLSLSQYSREGQEDFFPVRTAREQVQRVDPQRGKGLLSLSPCFLPFIKPPVQCLDGSRVHTQRQVLGRFVRPPTTPQKNINI